MGLAEYSYWWMLSHSAHSYGVPMRWRVHYYSSAPVSSGLYAVMYKYMLKPRYEMFSRVHDWRNDGLSFDGARLRIANEIVAWCPG